ncbi:MarR family transcriptional regulator [Roseomonas sp. HJA6]|uniref:MarR family transcriptional regulator n=1 Tax=Roseomonas alba TaxID=2846776 RepID=A0ABS7ADU1_9PROT|nr:MarR family transcriptional regulator [Neoroseomonas alba]MBW6400484.1 MarR family transcriptional regulator [Neoroseomonas alba]
MTAIPDLSDHLGYWLRQVSNHVSHAFARRLADQDVTVAEWALMRVLHGEAPMAPSRIADRMGMTRGAVTKLADRLIAKGLLVREASPEDGRAQTLSLTEPGAGFVPRLAALADANDAACFGHLPDADRAALGRILRDMVRHLGVTTVAID